MTMQAQGGDWAQRPQHPRQASRPLLAASPWDEASTFRKSQGLASEQEWQLGRAPWGEHRAQTGL